MAIGDGDDGGGQALVVAEGQRQLVGTRAADLAWRNEALIIKALVPQRARCAPAASANLLFGCYSDPKNVCKHCTTQEEWARLEQFRNLPNRFCDHLGADRAHSGDEVIMLMTQDGQRAVILVLVFAKMQPKMQLFARCLGGNSLIFPLPAAFPFEAVLASRRTRLAVALPDCRWMAIDIRTSDEIMLEAVRLAWPWEVLSLKTRICCDRPSLMWLIVAGAGDDFAPEVTSRSGTRAAGASDAAFSAMDLDLDGLMHPATSSAGEAGEAFGGESDGDDNFPGH